ncbi:uncharacterized protein [Diadema setosum]|uniref:uncharacterized protein n=1 Tax=Diadema setosum TaxID=31175 RepID=UPI003B3B669A
MVHIPFTMASHDELVMEMATLEKMSVQERLKHARKRRAQQLKRYHQSDKEFTKRQRKNTNQMKEMQNRRGVTFAKNVELLEAAARGDIDEVRNLLESGVDPNMGNEDGLTALHQSCIDNNESMMRLLVEKGADVNVTDRELWTPLHAASTCGHRHLAQFLISRGAELLAINSDGNMPYDICEDEATLDYIESQMATQGITQDQIDELREVLPNEMLNDMQTLFKEGGDLEFRDSSGATPLHIAVANGYEKVVQYLLSHNVDVASRDDDGWQPIHAAVCWAQADIITMLVESGADLEARTHNDETPLSICEDEEIRTLIQQLKMEIQSNRIKSSNLIRRSSSRNKRGSSIRRSSKREKGEMRKLDAKGEAAFIQSKSEELENSTESSPVTHIDDIQVSEETTNGHIASEGDETKDKTTPEGDEEGRVTPMPVIKEELSDRDPESPRNKKTNGDLSATAGADGMQENGDLDDMIEGAPSIAQQKRLVSILKKRPEDDGLKSEKSKKERKEEKEKERKEQKERERAEKQRLKEEKAQRKKEEEQRKREERRRREEGQGSGGGDTSAEGGEQYYSGGGETLAERKKLRSASQKAGGDHTEEEQSTPRSKPTATTDKSNAKQVKGPHPKIRIRPLTGRYDFKVEDSQGQNGDAGVTEDRHDNQDGEMKRFSGMEVVGEEPSRNCCIIS